MNTPLILIAGKAGVGKDTLGAYLAQTHNGICIGFADPLKRLASSIFGFTYEQLWGPSESRNAVDDRYASSERLAWDQASEHAFRVDLAPLGCGTEEARSSLLLTVSNLRGQQEPLTPRLALQHLGTGWGRDQVDPELWTKAAVKSALVLLGSGYGYARELGVFKDSSKRCHCVIVTDGRFPNEIMAVRQVNGVVLKIDRPVQTLNLTDAAHASETSLDNTPSYFYDYVIFNDGSIGNLNGSGESAFRGLFPDGWSMT